MIFLFATLGSTGIFASDISISDSKNINEPLCKDHNFLVAGHIYGNYKNDRSIFPSSSFLANIDFINDYSSSFFILLGDSYRLPRKDHIQAFKSSVKDKLEMPIYSVIGNHESVDREAYKQIFGETFFSFSICENLFLFLDSEESFDSRFSENQLTFLRETLAKTDKIQNIFIFSHKLIWASEDNKYSPIWHKMNVRGRYSDYEYYASNIKPLIDETSLLHPTFFISGDIGLLSPKTIFYDQTANVTYVATGLGDRADDHILSVSISSDHEVTFKSISLADQSIDEINQSNLASWTENTNPASEEFSLRDIPAAMKALIVFIIGFLTGILFWSYFRRNS